MNSADEEDFVPPRDQIRHWALDWTQPVQRVSYIKNRWTHYERPYGMDFQAYMTWDKTLRDGTSLKERWRDMWFSKLDISDVDSEWHFTQPLGRGGFGVVALFERRGLGSGKLLDQLVTKTTVATGRDAVDRQRPYLAREAVMMDQTNQRMSDGMLRLRQFKHFPEDLQWKYYMEYCAHGDLERLRMRYKAYGRYLPELFLWHLFYWLAHTLYEYSQNTQWVATDHEDWGLIVENGFLLHSDIKNQNILLGDPDPNAPHGFNLYPIPRIGDLGLAEVLSEDLVGTEAARYVKGTRAWMPPEIRYQKIDKRSSFYPFGSQQTTIGSNISSYEIDDRWRKGMHAMSSRANIWPIGAVMYSMVTMHEISSLSNIVDDILGERIPLPGPHRSIITEDDFGLPSHQHYSTELLELIMDCLRLQPENRPDEKELLDAAAQGYTNCLSALYAQGYGMTNQVTLHDAVTTLPEYKLYYRKNEIDSAPDNYEYDHGRLGTSFWSRFIYDYIWLPSHWGRLWPDTMPDTNVPVPGGWPEEFQRGMRHMVLEMRRWRQERRALDGRPEFDVSQQQHHHHHHQQQDRNVDQRADTPMPRQMQPPAQPNAPRAFDIVRHLGLQDQPGFADVLRDNHDHNHGAEHQGGGGMNTLDRLLLFSWGDRANQGPGDAPPANLGLRGGDGNGVGGAHADPALAAAAAMPPPAPAPGLDPVVSNGPIRTSRARSRPERYAPYFVPRGRGR